MVESEQKSSYSWNQKSTLYSCDYLSGQFLDIDTKALEKMILENHAKKRLMHEDPNNIRGEDIRIDYDENVRKLKDRLCDEYKLRTGNEIELCCDENPKIHKDRNESYWAIVHEKGDTTQLHSHENHKNYAAGPHVSAVFWIKVPDNSGNFVFQYNPNKYVVSETALKSIEGFFLIFDSTVKHRVTENLSNDQRIVISMNFNLVGVYDV